MTKDRFAGGVELLRQPVMPLVSIVQFLFMTGPFETVAEVITQLPEPIETDRTTYADPGGLLASYGDLLAGLEPVKRGEDNGMLVVDENNEPVDQVTGGTALVRQRILTAELEEINSSLCGPCRCTLCCVGPEQDMEQEFFEIPLAEGELGLFPGERHDSEETRQHRSADPVELQVDGEPFYRIGQPAAIHWQYGWSLILPHGSRCPNLAPDGLCRVYAGRPEVCRRPQIFPYMVEPLEQEHSGGKKMFRIRQSLLAITDCPYVTALQEEISDYAAASELHMVFNRNKA